MNNVIYEATIGLEIHVETKSNSKMFSSAPNVYGKKPNTSVLPIDLGMPGTLPTVNKKAVENAIKLSNALHMEIDHTLYFDRKNYFYSDLPKGYQITQNERPIGKNGYLLVKLDGKEVRVDIERLHMEEDTCKQLHYTDFTLLDYNRAGVPLCEIVTLPCIHDAKVARLYVEKIREICVYLDVSDGKMEEGSLRCDVNISIAPKGSEQFGTKVEIKNLNSTANVEKAIAYEIERQKSLIENGEKVRQETRRFDESKMETVLMRVKTDAVDYKYFSEPNILPISLSDKFIEDTISSSYELADVKFERYTQEFKVSEYDALTLLKNRSLALLFDEAVETCSYYDLLIHFINGDVLTYVSGMNATFNLSAKHLGELINLVGEKKISNAQARDIFKQIVKSDESPIDIVKKNDISQISDEATLLKLINRLLDENPTAIQDFKNGKGRAASFLVGQIMKETKGKANPALASKLLNEEFKKR